MAREQSADDGGLAPADYTEYRLYTDGIPTGLSLTAETRQDAERLLEVAAARLDFSASGVELREADE